MNERELNPYVRFLQRRSGPILYHRAVFAYDYRLIYVCRGRITLVLGGECVPVSAGEAITVPPAVGYRLVFDGGEVEYFIVNFDFVQDAANLTPRAPDSIELFSEEKCFSRECPPCFEAARHFENAGVIELYLDELEGLTNWSSVGAGIVRSALMKQIIGRLVLLSERAVVCGNADCVTKARAYVEQNISGSLANRDIARELGYHPHYLSSRFLKTEGITLHSYVEQARIKRAKELLVLGDMPVYRVAELCGFAEASYFIKFFVRHEGVTPGEYRRIAL